MRFSHDTLLQEVRGVKVPQVEVNGKLKDAYVFDEVAMCNGAWVGLYVTNQSLTQTIDMPAGAIEALAVPVYVLPNLQGQPDMAEAEGQIRIMAAAHRTKIEEGLSIPCPELIIPELRGLWELVEPTQRVRVSAQIGLYTPDRWQEIQYELLDKLK